jgi:hypothetical protein
MTGAAGQSTTSLPTGPGDGFDDRPGYRIRAAHLQVENIGLVERAAQAGIDTLLAPIPRLRAPLDFTAREQLVQFAHACQRHGIAFWPEIRYFGEVELTWIGPYRHFVDGNGKRLNHTPCPLDEELWRRAVEARYLLLAELSRDCPITGVALDTEMYAADAGGVSQVCYCGDCLARTLRAAGQDAAPPYPDRRREWLTQIGLLDAHFQTTRDAVRTLAEQTRDRVAQVAPDLRLGAFNIDDAVPPMQGILLGWGRSDRPVYVYTEVTYTQGYSPYVRQAQQRMGQLGAHFCMIAGVWQSKFLARALTAHLYECARNSAGYWIYTFESFVRPDYAPLPGKADDYWSAIRQANDELLHLAANPEYQTSLKIEPFVLPPTPATARGVERPELVPLRPPTGEPQPPARLRRNNILYVYAESGRRVTLPMRLVQTPGLRDGGQYLLVSPGGRCLERRDLLEVDRLVKLGFQAEQTGLYAVALSAGACTIQVEGPQPYAIAADTGVPARLFIGIPALYVLARPGQREVTLQMGVGGEAERVHAVVTQGDHVLYDGVLADTRAIVLSVDPDAQPSILKIDVQRVPGAVRENFSVAVVKGAYPFVAVSPEGLLRD